MAAASSFARSCAICPSANSVFQSAMPVRMMLTPAAATAASPFPPPGLARSAGGAFESAIGNSLRPPVTRAPVAESIVTLATDRA